MMRSEVSERGFVTFPKFTGERIYMREFRKADGLPADIRRWQDTVDAMLDGIDAAGPIFLMVDQGTVRADATHRRGGVHVDGYWNPGIQAHGAPAPSHRGWPEPGRHDVPGRSPLHIHASRGGHDGHRIGTGPLEPEALVLASNVQGCRAFVGAFDAMPGKDGDCSHIEVEGLDVVDMEPGRAYAGHTLSMLHESVPLKWDSLRTVVRLNVRGWVPI